MPVIPHHIRATQQVKQNDQDNRQQNTTTALTLSNESASSIHVRQAHWTAGQTCHACVCARTRAHCKCDTNKTHHGSTGLPSPVCPGVCEPKQDAHQHVLHSLVLLLRPQHTLAAASPASCDHTRRNRGRCTAFAVTPAPIAATHSRHCCHSQPLLPPLSRHCAA